MLAENLRALITEVVKAKPSTAKGKYLKKISLSSSIGAKSNGGRGFIFIDFVKLF